MGFSAGVMIYISLVELLGIADKGLSTLYGARTGAALAAGAFFAGMSQDQMKKSLAEGISGENLDIIAGSAPSADTKRKNRIKYRVLELLAKQYDVKEEDFSSAELEAVPAAKPREVGFDRSLIAAYGHDDRVCAYSALYALLNTKGTPERTLCALLCDKEEIGSYGATGMQATRCRPGPMR